jgi:hypothetical protein
MKPNVSSGHFLLIPAENLVCRLWLPLQTKGRAAHEASFDKEQTLVTQFSLNENA